MLYTVLASTITVLLEEELPASNVTAGTAVDEYHWLLPKVPPFGRKGMEPDL